MQNIRVKQASLAGHLLAACVAVLLAGTAGGEEPTDAEAAEKPLVGASDTGSPLTVEETLFPEVEPIPDRWRIKTPPYQRNVEGAWYDPYNLNTIKGDYPIFNTQDLFFRLTAASRANIEGRSFPIPSGVSAKNPGSYGFFGNNDSFLYDHKVALKADLFKGNTAFRPPDFQITVEGVLDWQNLKVNENAVIDVDVREGINRWTSDAALQQAFIEYHIADVSNRYDFISVKAGRQPFNSDFRSLIFFDTNQGVRLFGSADGNRYQWNLLGFYQAEKDTFSELNTFDLRDQLVAVANLYAQDLFFLGWQNQISFHADYDMGKESGFTFAEDGTLVRPDPVGIAKPHNVQAYYLGWTSDGHIERLNISHAFYQALGKDTLNPIAGREIDINAQLAFLELSVDVDWMRYQASVFFTSGDDDPRNGEGRGFDSIFDFPRIMGGDFGYWNRQGIRIADRGGVGLVQRQSIVPDLRSSKIQGQANFVNPGLLMFNVGATAEVTQTFRTILNVNYLRFVETEPLEILLKQPQIRDDIGLDVSLGVEYRPLLSNNIIIRAFSAFLQPWGGFVDIYQPNTLYQVGTEVILVF
jgi:hypothetical protein